MSTGTCGGPIAVTFPGSCEFCVELHDLRNSRFYRTYHQHAESRVLARSDGFVAIPTLGQLFANSLLVLPVEHDETMARSYRRTGREALSFVDAAQRRIPAPQIVLFEHGATHATGGSCGIYHAHLHVVPVPGAVSCADVLPESIVEWMPSVQMAWEYLADSTEYLLFRGTDGRTGVVDSSRAPGRFPSQYFRRALAERFAVDRAWDWRGYEEVESDVLNALGLADHVPVS
jgi:hypothetical protein